MDAPPSGAPSDSPTPFRRFLQTLGQWLVEPSPEIKELDRRRQARTLAITILTLIGLGLLLEVLTFVGNYYYQYEEPYSGYIVTLLTFVPLGVAYALCRTRYLSWGSVLTVVTVSLAVFARALNDDPRYVADYLNYLVLPLIIGSMFLNFRQLLAIATLDFAGMLLIPLITPEISVEVIVTTVVSNLMAVGVLFAIAAWYRDLIEKDRQAMLRESEAKYRTLVEQIPAITYLDVITSSSSSGTSPVYLSPQFEKYLGYTLAEYEADPGLWSNVIHPEDREWVRAAAGQYYQTGSPNVSEYRLVAKDGRVLWFRDHATLRWDEASKRRLSQGILLDITDAKRAEENIRREAARAGALLRVADRLNAQLTLETLLATVCEETARALDVHISSVSLYDEKEDALIVSAWSGGTVLPQDLMPVLPRKAYERGMQEYGPVIALPNIEAMPDLPHMEMYLQLGVRAMAGASMVYNNEFIGSLNAISLGQERHFTEDEKLLLQGLAAQAALAIVNTRVFKEARRRLEQLQALRTIDIAITSNLDLATTLNTLLESITSQLNVDAAVVLLLDEASQTLQYGASRGFKTEALKYTRLHLGEGYAGRAALERRIFSVANISQNNPAFAQSPLLIGEKFSTYFAAPLIAKSQVRGVVEIFHRTPLDPDEEWLSFLEALAGQAAIAIDNSTLFDALQRTNAELASAYDATIEGWSRALDLRDKETEGHTLRVTEMTLRLARALGLPEDQLTHIRRGAMLHDIGKMGIPDNILLKPDKLDDEEWEIMKRHPTYAYEMLLPITYLRPALDIPYCHHEKWDGTGYPRGLKGEQIPLSARVFALADVWDALCSDRPYRKRWPTEQVREHIKSLAGTHFDPKLVELFLRFISEP